jgi:urease beta subunit
MNPGEIIPAGSSIGFNEKPPPDWPSGREWKRRVWVKNDGDRAIQVGSHFHFYEANSGFAKDSDDPAEENQVGYSPEGLVILKSENGPPLTPAEKKSLIAGYRLDIPAGTAWRFEPDGTPEEVPLVGLSGKGTVWGLSTDGMLKKFRWIPAPATQGQSSNQAGPRPLGPVRRLFGLPGAALSRLLAGFRRGSKAPRPPGSTGGSA